MEATPHPNSRIPRLAAGLFFFICVPLAIWDQSYVPQKIFVAQDPVATAKNLLANEFIFRTTIITRLAGILAFALMILLFARIFRKVDKHLCQLMVFAVLAMLPIYFILEVCNYTALMVVKSEPRETFGIPEQQEAAYFLMRMYRYAAGPGLGKLFLGLCFVPFGTVVLRSGFAPRAIGILLIMGGVGYLADCCIAVLLQRADYVVVRSYLMFTTLAYILALLWFMVKGVREPRGVVVDSK